MDRYNCPNSANHVPDYPAFDRAPCPCFCGMYVRKVEGVKYPTQGQVHDALVRDDQAKFPPRPTAADANRYVKDLVARAKRDFLGLSDQEQALLNDLAKTTWDLARVQANQAGGEMGEVARYLVTINDAKYWTVRLAKDQGGGWLARDKDLAVALRAAADKLEADARTGAAK